MSNNKFNFFIPLDIQKGTQEGELVKIKGIASTDAKDSDEEILIPAGFDFAPLLSNGFLNWNHQAKTTSKAICGEPTTAQVINNGKDFYIEGVLYPNEEGKNVVHLAETLQKYSPNRRLGFSIEGQALERDILNPKKVTKARITGVAITQSPKNPNTLMSIVKGEYDNEFIEVGEKTDDGISLDMIVSMLFNIQVKLEHCHRQTKNESVHRALGEAYEGFADLKDAIIEQLIGLADANYSTLSLQGIAGYADSMNDEVADQLCSFGRTLQSYAQRRDYSSIENLAQDVYGLGAKLKYKLTLKEGSEEGQVNKAMTVNQDINPPSIEGTKKEPKVVNLLKKSEIYNKIRERYTDDFQKAETIYSFINKINKEMFDKEAITLETLEKAEAILDDILSKANSADDAGSQKSLKDYDKKDEVLEKTEEGKEDDKDKNKEAEDTPIKKVEGDGDDKGGESDDDEDDFDKAMIVEGFAKSLMEQGKSPEQIVKAMTDVGVSLKLAEISYANCIAQLTESDIQGGKVTVQKSEQDELGGSSRKINAFATLLKKSMEDNKVLTARIDKMEEQAKLAPVQRKSAVTAREIERFEKSASASGIETYSMSNPQDVKILSDKLFKAAVNLRENGQEDKALEKASSELEIAKSTDFGVIDSQLKRLNIQVMR